MEEDQPGATTEGEHQGNVCATMASRSGALVCQVSLKKAATRAASSEESEAVVEQREWAHKVIPSRWVGGVCDEQLEEDDSGVWRGWGRGHVGGGAKAKVICRLEGNVK